MSMPGRWWVAPLVVLACGTGPGNDATRGAPAPPQAEIQPAPEWIGAPLDAVRFCGGHVTGAPGADGRPGPHLVWDAYYSLIEPDELAAGYPKQYPTPERSHDGACVEWRLTAVSPRRVLEICPPDVEGPWTECDAPPPETRSIVLVSDLLEAK